MAADYCAAAIIRTPDWNGGHNDVLELFRTYQDADEYTDNLPDFTYCEWIGWVTDLPTAPTLTGHVEPFHEKPRDYEWQWFEDEAVLAIT